MKLTDQSPMPIGKHRGEKMEDVPARYLLWLWDQGVWREVDSDLHAYIKESFSALETEARDYIVQHPPNIP